jgi:hypothetical protein
MCSVTEVPVNTFILIVTEIPFYLNNTANKGNRIMERFLHENCLFRITLVGSVSVCSVRI